MNKIALRFGINRQWNHLYYQNFSYLDPRLIHGTLQSPSAKRDQYLKRIISGLVKFKKIEIHKTREVVDIYISKERNVSTPLFKMAFSNHFNTFFPNKFNTIELTSKHGFRNTNLAMYRVLFNIFKTRIQIFNLYTFPIHDAELLIKYLLRDYKNKARLNIFKRLLKLGIIKGIKIKIQGRYKKSTRTQNEVYQFGQIPNTPTTDLQVQLFYTSHVLLQPLGTSSLHIYIVYHK
jgi:hypothetical protein